MVRVRGINKVRAKGRIYYYDRKSGTRLTAPFGTPEFFAEIAAARGSRPTIIPGSLGSLIHAYRASPEFQGLAQRTKADYQKVFDWLQPLDPQPIGSFTSERILAIRDKAFASHKRRFANYVVQVVRLLMAWGKPRGFARENQARDVKLIPRPRDARRINRAWTDGEFDVVLQAASPMLKPAIALGGYVGMRQGDVLKLPWGAYDGQYIRFVQGKTGTPLEVPAARGLRVILDDTKRHALIIVATKRKQEYVSYTASGFRASFFRLIRKLEQAGRVGRGLTFHGLRHTAAKNLLDAGCDSRTAMAITGHKSEAAFSIYAQEANQRIRARVGITKLDRFKKKSNHERDA